jgi:hypothetical protein
MSSQKINPRTGQFNLVGEGGATNWNDIVGKPSSTPANIDSAVSAKHDQNTDHILQALNSDFVDILGEATFTAGQTYSVYTPDLAHNGNINYQDGWIGEGTLPNWIKADFGVGNEKIITKARIISEIQDHTTRLKDYKIQGSNNNSDWTDLATVVYPNERVWQYVNFVNTTAYRYYRLYCMSNYNVEITNTIYIIEWELSEDTGIVDIINEGELINDLAVQNGITVDGRDISVDGTKLDTLQSPLTGNVTYYVSTTGNDITGDGSSGTPFATIAHALNLIPKNLNGFTASVLINTGTYIEQGIRCESFKNGHLIIGKVSGTVTITSVSGSGDFIFYIWYNSAQVSINNLNLQVLDNNLFCLDIENCISVDATQMKFGDNGNTGTKGLYAFRSVVTAGCSDIDANKVSIGLYADDGSNILLYGLNTWGDTFLEPDAAGTIKDTNNLMLTGELSIKVYAQASEPTLTADNRIAIWIDTDDANKVYLLFRRGSGDQVKILFNL